MNEEVKTISNIEVSTTLHALESRLTLLSAVMPDEDMMICSKVSAGMYDHLTAIQRDMRALRLRVEADDAA
ncbi:MAG: hypothetical protein R8M45_11930 [Ghiorsea sp.]